MHFIGNIVGIDGGIGNIGVATLGAYFTDALKLQLRVEGTQLFQTFCADKDKKLRTYATDDFVRRLREIGTYFEDHVLQSNVAAVCMEDISNISANRTASYQLNAVFGVVVEATRAKSIPLYRESPQAIKKKLTGKVKASKEEIEFAVSKLFNYNNWSVRASDANHEADAIATAYCAINNDLVVQNLRTAYMIGKQLANGNNKSSA